MADNPISWFILMLLGLFFVARFLLSIIKEAEACRLEREREAQEIFLENPLDKRNIMAYNRSIKKEGNRYEFYDDRYGDDQRP